MMLFVGSTGDRAGHSLVTWTLARRLTERGLKVGFFKPFGTDPIPLDGVWTDPDARLFKNVLHLQEPLTTICPFPLPDEVRMKGKGNRVLLQIRSLTQELARDKDLLLIMGSRHVFFEGTTHAVPDIFLITELKLNLLLIQRYRKPADTLYTILSLASLLRHQLKGVLINRVLPEKMDEVDRAVVQPLKRKGIFIPAVIPEDPSLAFRTLGDTAAALGGEFLCGKEKTGHLVGGMTPGASDLKGELRLFKRLYNKIVLLAPPNPPETHEEDHGMRKVEGILLTGGRRPPVRIFQLAKKNGIPLILIEEDTFVTLEKLAQQKPVLSPGDDLKVQRFTECLKHHADPDILLRPWG